MSRKRVLIIDDEDDIREVAEMTLELGGFEVITAAGGCEGVERALAEQPDGILLDVMMPGVDGPETFSRLQELEATRHIPVVFLTAKVQAADRRSLAALGARAILSKPFDPQQLAADINDAMGWSATSTDTGKLIR